MTERIFYSFQEHFAISILPLKHFHPRLLKCVINICLQPAVEALSEREAQLALRNEIENGNIDDFVDNDFEWNNGEKFVVV